MKGKFLFAALLLLGVIAVLTRRSQVSSTTPLPVAPSSTQATPPTTTEPSLSELTVQRRQRMISTDQERGDDFKLSEHDIYLYLEANRSNAISLVTAFEASRDLEFLKRASVLFPNDPIIQAKVLMHNALPEEREKWIEAFKKSAPENAFANLLSAREAFQKGDTRAALAEVKAAAEKSFDDYTRESSQGLEEAYLAAGRSVAEAKLLGSSEIAWPHLVQLKYLGRQMTEAAKTSTSGNIEEQAELLRANWSIGAQLRDSSNKSILYELVGIAMQNLTYNSWPSTLPIADFNFAERIEADRIRRKELKDAGPLFMKWFPTAPDEEIVSYMDRSKMFGEMSAYQWLKQRHPDLLQ